MKELYFSALHREVSKEKVDIVNILADDQRVDVNLIPENYSYEDSKSPLHLAIDMSNAKIVEIFNISNKN